MPPKKPVPAKPAPVGRGRAAAPARGGKTAPAAKTGAKPAAGTQQAKGKPVVKGAGKATEAQKPKEKVWTKQDDAARKIQTSYRGHLAKKQLQKLKQEKEDYEELMDKLEKEAFVKLVKMEQEQAEKQRLKEEEERREKREAKQRMKRMLEAAFDGDTNEIITILKEVKDFDDKKGLGDDIIGSVTRAKHQLDMVNCEDSNENTPVSEAASGGSLDAVKLLIERGADVNSVGQFRRTPLYRAAFAGHMEVVQYLLEQGGDPRIYDSEGQSPADITSVPAIATLLTDWDIAETENILQKIQIQKEKFAEEERKKKAAVTNKIEDEIAKAQTEYDIASKRLSKAYCEMNKRITEHDEVVLEGKEIQSVTLQVVHDAEAEVEIAKIDLDKARDKLNSLKIKLRDQEHEGSEEDLPGLKVPVRELTEVLLRDVGNKIRDSGKWALIIDPSAQAATFLRYQNTNYINTLRPGDMEPDKIRLALLGAIRYGKPLVLDMMEIDMYDACDTRFDYIEKGLFQSLMDKSLLQDQKYVSLIRESDGKEYNKNEFNDLRVSQFKFFVISKNPYPSEKLLDQCFVIRVHVPV